jgi:hypothetical protein
MFPAAAKTPDVICRVWEKWLIFDILGPTTNRPAETDFKPLRFS